MILELPDHQQVEPVMSLPVGYLLEVLLYQTVLSRKGGSIISERSVN